MSINVRSDQMQHAEIFGKPVLYTNWLIPRDTVPAGWYCYDLRGSEKIPMMAVTLENQAVVDHVGTVLSPVPLKKPNTAARRINGTFFLHGELMDLENFCEEHDLDYPAETRKYILNPASPDEAGLFFSQDEEQDLTHGCIGHVRFDHGSGKEFWSTWWSRGTALESDAFWEEHKAVMEEIGQNGPLHDRGAMARFCAEHPETALHDSYGSHGFKLETDQCCYYVRCDPRPGDYSYIYIYDRATLEQSHGAAQTAQEGPQMKGM